jgi:hypothetical protein
MSEISLQSTVDASWPKRKPGEARTESLWGRATAVLYSVEFSSLRRFVGWQLYGESWQCPMVIDHALYTNDKVSQLPRKRKDLVYGLVGETVISVAVMPSEIS